MNCPTGCPPFSTTRCRRCPRKYGTDSLNTYGKEQVVTTCLIGSPEPDDQSQPRPSSVTERALLILAEAWHQVSELDNSRERSMVLTKIEEAELWLLRLKNIDG